MASVIGRQDRGWLPVDPTEGHPLRQLIGRQVGAYVIRLLEGPRSRFGARYFRLHLENSGGRLCTEPAVVGLYSSGRHPSQNWIEIASVSLTATFTGQRRYSIDPEASEAGRQVWQLLGDAIPPGGHLMVEYESQEWRETERGLAKNIPPVATPLGQLIFRIGCGVNFKDWYFSEGLHEGPRKLQGWKAMDEPHRRRRAKGMAEELHAFLASSCVEPRSPLIERARRRARAVLSQLRLLDDEVAAA